MTMRVVDGGTMWVVEMGMVNILMLVLIKGEVVGLALVLLLVFVVGVLVGECWG